MKTILLSLSFLLSFITVQAQNPETALTNYSGKYSREKIFIDYDRYQYSAGDTIWFKAYLVQNSLPSTESHNFYLQLVDGNGHILSKKVYPISGATVSGIIELPDSIAQGNYYIRALTPRMLNGSESLIYHKSLFLTSSFNKAASPSSAPPLRVLFYPEGGSLVEGVPSIVAFKALDANNLPVDVSGTIKSSTGATMAPFKTYHDGIGKVQINSRPGQTYTAEVVFRGKTYTFPLPQPKPSGIILKVQDEKGGKMFQLEQGAKDKTMFNTITLLVQQNNHVIYNNSISFDGYPSVRGHLLTDSLPSGILHFTVFDQQSNPIVERLAFVNNGEYRSSADITLSANNNVSAAFSDASQRSLSASITRANLSPSGDNETIASRLLLSSELKDYIYNSAYYLQPGDSVKQALDNLLLTYTWSQFKWKDVLAGALPQQTINDTYLRSFSGRVVNEKDNQSVSGGKLDIFLEENDTATRTFTVAVDPSGKFILDSLALTGESKLSYHYSKGGKSQQAKIEVDENLLDKTVSQLPSNWAEVVAGLPLNTSVSANGAKANNAPSKSKELPPVKVTGDAPQRKESTNEMLSTGVFRSGGRIVYDYATANEGNQLISVVDYIAQNINTVKLVGDQFVNGKNFSMSTMQNWIVGLYVNEMYNGVSAARAIRLQDVALIKFYEAGFVGVGSTYPGGAIAVYLKKNEEKKNTAPKKTLPFIVYSGYSASPAFTSSANSKTIYWNPSLLSTGSSTINFSFPNPTQKTNLHIRIEGFDTKGKLIHLEKTTD